MPIMINNFEISDDEVFREMQHHPSESAQEAMTKAAQALTIRHLLLKEAEKLGFRENPNSCESTARTVVTTPEPEAVENAIAALLEKKIVVPTVDEETLHNFYQRNPQLFAQGSQRPTFEDCREPIAQYLVDAAWQSAVKAYIGHLIGQARIEGVRF